MRPVLMLLLIPATVGAVAFRLTQRKGSRAGWLVWSIALVVAFAVIRPRYVSMSHCEAPATWIVPFIGAFAAASGAWVGIQRGRNGEQEYWLARVALESGLYAMVPGIFFILTLWPCR